jgi:hypothetical protein
MGGMRRQDSDYRGWTLCVVPGCPCLGHAVRRGPPHQVVMAKGRGEERVLRSLRRQVDEFEDDRDVAGETSGGLLVAAGRIPDPGLRLPEHGDGFRSVDGT